MAKRKANGFRPYKTYVFRGRDPVFDILENAIGDETYGKLAKDSGVSSSTYSSWFKTKKTRRPQFCTLQATAMARGLEFRLIKAK